MEPIYDTCVAAPAAQVVEACNPQNLTNFVSGFAMMGRPLQGDDLEVHNG